MIHDKQQPLIKFTDVVYAISITGWLYWLGYCIWEARR